MDLSYEYIVFMSIAKFNFYFPGLLVYFVYGIHYSRENKKTQGYGPMVEYTGDATIPENTISGMTEEVKELQPQRKDEGLYQ